MVSQIGQTLINVQLVVEEDIKQAQEVVIILLQLMVVKTVLGTPKRLRNVEPNLVQVSVRRSHPEVFFRKRCSENMQQIYRRKPMPKCDFNKVALQLHWNYTSAWVFSEVYREPLIQNVINYFRKRFGLACLAGFWTRLWFYSLSPFKREPLCNVLENMINFCTIKISEKKSAKENFLHEMPTISLKIL